MIKQRARSMKLFHNKTSLHDRLVHDYAFLTEYVQFVVQCAKVLIYSMDIDVAQQALSTAILLFCQIHIRMECNCHESNNSESMSLYVRCAQA